MSKKMRSAAQLITLLLLFIILTGLGACSQSQAPTSGTISGSQEQTSQTTHPQRTETPSKKEDNVLQLPVSDPGEVIERSKVETVSGTSAKVGMQAEKSAEDEPMTMEKADQESARKRTDEDRKLSKQSSGRDREFSASAPPIKGFSKDTDLPSRSISPSRMPRPSPKLSDPGHTTTSSSGRDGQIKAVSVQKPVYNALFSPVASRSPLVLNDHKPTTITFYIGPKDPGSVLSQKQQQLSPAIINKTDIDLMVTMKCLVCLENSLQIKPIQYSGSLGRSTSASFDIVPNRNAIENEEGFGHITFNVSGSGIEYDHIVTCVFVGLTTKNTHHKSNLCEPQEFTAVVSDASSDLEIEISDRSIGGGIGIALNPHHQKLRQLFAGRHLESGGLKIFKTGLTSRGQVKELVKAGYIQLRQISEQNNKILSSSMEGTPTGAVVLSDSSQIALSDADRDKIVAVLAEFGQDLYRQFFIDGDHELFELIDLLEQDDLGELRIVIKTAGLYVPWQFLHKTGNVDPHQFWGMKYRLAALPIMRTTQGRLPDRIPPPTKDEAVFGHYRGVGEKDPVARLGIMQGERLAGMLKGAAQLSTTSSNGDFLAKLRTQSQTLKLVTTYGHASSGTAFLAAGKETVMAQTIEGQRLLFTQKEYVQPKDLRRLRNSLPPKEARKLFFALQPLVFLNGCETGTGGITSTTDASFPGVLVNLGARGVFVTEAPVWDLFGFHFGNTLLKALLIGTPSAQTLLDARRQFLTNNNNPLGLFYAYYGNPDAGFSAE